MNVCLVDVDSKIPNLALMKISAFHKQQGDRVKLGYEPLFDDPDLCYASKIFDFTDEPEYMPECEIRRGGTGYDITAKVDIPDYERVMPDYSLYGCEYAIGRFTRGCPNRCPWCVVPKMDGNDVRHVSDLSDFWNGQSCVRLLDDNIMSDEIVFEDACRQLHDAGVEVVWDALDIRCVTRRTAESLASVKLAKRPHFSWDSQAQDKYIAGGLELLKRAGIAPSRTFFYVLVGFGTTPEYDMHRIKTIDELGSNPFVMPFDKSDPYQKHLARWCNAKPVFRTCSFDEYEPWIKERRKRGM